jgi:hypothetical protein
MLWHLTSPIPHHWNSEANQVSVSCNQWQNNGLYHCRMYPDIGKW